MTQPSIFDDPNFDAEQYVASILAQQPMQQSGIAGQLFEGGLSGATFGLFDPSTANKGQPATQVGNIAGSIAALLGGNAVAGAKGLAIAGGAMGAGQEVRQQGDEIKAGQRQDYNLPRVALSSGATAAGALAPLAPKGAPALVRSVIGAAGNAAATGSEIGIGNLLDSVQRDAAGPTAISALIGGALGPLVGGASKVEPTAKAVTPSAPLQLPGRDIPLLPDNILPPKQIPLLPGEVVDPSQPIRQPGQTIDFLPGKDIPLLPDNILPPKEPIPQPGKIMDQLPGGTLNEVRLLPQYAESVSAPKPKYEIMASPDKGRPSVKIGPGLYAVADNIADLADVPNPTIHKGGNKPSVIIGGREATVLSEVGDFMKVRYKNGGSDIVAKQITPDIAPKTEPAPVPVQESALAPVDIPPPADVSPQAVEPIPPPQGFIQDTRPSVPRKGGTTEPGEFGTFTNPQEFQQLQPGVFDSLPEPKQRAVMSAFQGIESGSAIEFEYVPQNSRSSGLRRAKILPTHIDTTGSKLRISGINDDGAPHRYIIDDPQNPDIGIRGEVKLSNPEIQQISGRPDVQPQISAEAIRSLDATIEKATRLFPGDVKVKALKKILDDPQTRVSEVKMKQFMDEFDKLSDRVKKKLTEQSGCS